MPPRVLRSVDDLHLHKTDWFCYQALRCIQMTNPDVAEEGIREGGRYRVNVSFWLTKVFDSGQLTSAEKPTPPNKPSEKDIEGCVQVDKLYNTVIAEYFDAKLKWVPADLIDFQGGEKPNITIRSVAMMRQDQYQKSLVGTWNAHLLVYLFRKRLYEDKYETSPFHRLLYLKLTILLYFTVITEGKDTAKFLAAIASSHKEIFLKLRELGLTEAIQLGREMFADPLSDYITLLNAFQSFCGKISIEGIDDLRANRQQLVGCWRSMYPKDDLFQSYSIINEDYADRLRQALAHGLSINTAFCRQEDMYVTIHDNYEDLIEPHSALTGAKHDWIVFTRFRLGVKAYFDVVRAIKPELIEDLPYFQPERLPQRFDLPKQLLVSKSLEVARQKKTWSEDLAPAERSTLRNAKTYISHGSQVRIRLDVPIWKKAIENNGLDSICNDESVLARFPQVDTNR
ncbi:hypothetical protein PG996_001606 [Apiospora saccharicola]|uniref:Uncharacterized protein n=1 Tax=Apiospora saccharicola TaxID=335842 RepID=A0ABR1WH34_9PEZI